PRRGGAGFQNHIAGRSDRDVRWGPREAAVRVAIADQRRGTTAIPRTLPGFHLDADIRERPFYATQNTARGSDGAQSVFDCIAPHRELRDSPHRYPGALDAES